MGLVPNHVMRAFSKFFLQHMNMGRLFLNQLHIKLSQKAKPNCVSFSIQSLIIPEVNILKKVVLNLNGELDLQLFVTTLFVLGYQLNILYCYFLTQLM